MALGQSESKSSMSTPLGDEIDRLLAEVERLTRERDNHAESFKQQHQANVELLERAESAERREQEARKDAERYRWLRDEAHPDREDTGVACKETHMTDWGKWYEKFLSGEELDAAIDAALRSKENQ